MADDAKHDAPKASKARGRGARKDDYTDDERKGFGIWVELGARDPSQQWIIDGSLSTRWERRDPSGSPWIKKLLMNPLRVLLAEKVPGLHAKSRITTTILHHHRGLEYRIISTTVTVEEETGDASMVIDKETPGSY
ncbi:MAG: hypothetical protein KY392_07240 [Chloroflexi bacterium]|nr:hypothetical protein [Chloroflexota bacterium]